MKSSLVMNFSVDRENKKIRVQREFAAPLKDVWAAWTKSEFLDQWWAPKPWKTKTKKMDFREGGHWLYAMVGPDGSEQWCRLDFRSVTSGKSYLSEDAFCDANGKIDESFPRCLWTTRFAEHSGSTMVDIEIQYKELADLEKYIEMGFREGFTAALENLDSLLERA